MNAKQRVHAALRRERVDRVPIFMWFHPDTAQWLGRFLGIPSEWVGEAFGNDVRQAWVGNNYAMEGITHEAEGQTHVDDWGIEWVRVGAFNQIRRYPLQHTSPQDLVRYEYPYARIPALLETMRPVMAASADHFVGCDVSPCLFEMVCRLRGMGEALLDLAAAPDVATAMLAQAGAFSLRLAEEACSQFALDWLWTGDDVGGQQAMMMSPRFWRQMIRPHLARIFEVGKAGGLWVAYHSCGAIRPIIPDLIEMGLDVLNPVQVHCPGMDPLSLKAEFGRRLTFMGGVDTQRLLPYGSASEVQRETERLLAGMTADGGGYILAASHTVPPETPVENILALYAAAGVTREEIYDRAADIRARLESA
ncbi:MAG: hypothetical protein GX601_08865 [Anaerolineales bacterium]|nr:hypothetical protein [Anaerolineales bacterium]